MLGGLESLSSEATRPLRSTPHRNPVTGNSVTPRRRDLVRSGQACVFIQRPKIKRRATGPRGGAQWRGHEQLVHAPHHRIGDLIETLKRCQCARRPEPASRYVLKARMQVRWQR
jgi:hypothetical protein